MVAFQTGQIEMEGNMLQMRRGIKYVQIVQNGMLALDFTSGMKQPMSIGKFSHHGAGGKDWEARLDGRE